MHFYPHAMLPNLLMPTRGFIKNNYHSSSFNLESLTSGENGIKLE